MSVTTVSTLAELTEAVAETRAAFGGDVWWRGHASASWKLVPGVFRGDRGYNCERTVVQEFRQRAGSRYHVCPSQNDRAGWLFLMQHYGLPTRLLDWSESPLVALYFAVQGVVGPASLFGLYPMSLNEKQIALQALIPPGGKDALAFIAPAFEDVAPPSATVVSRTLCKSG